MTSRASRHLLPVLLLCGVVVCRPAAAGPQKSAPDDWLAELALARLAKADVKDPSALAAQVEAMLLGRAGCGHFAQLGPINDLIYVHRACTLLPQAARIGGEEFALWLREHREVSRRLLRALEDAPGATRAIQRLHELYAHDANRVAEYANLSVAFATTIPARPRTQKPPPAALRESFDYYTAANVRFRFDLKAMPYELSRYLAVTPLSIEERKWAYADYFRHNNPPRSYFNVRYDIDHFRKGVPKKIAAHDYTLPNLREYGGVCIDQAYFAAGVCRSIGIPATIVTGRGRSGIGHAWLASLRPVNFGRQAQWDTHTGRYGDHLYYTGNLRDPASGKAILDSELALAGFSTLLPLEQREQADAALALARLLHANPKADLASRVKALAEAAKDYAALAEAAGAADISWVVPADRKPAQLVEDLVAAAIVRDLALKHAWEFVLALRRERGTQTRSDASGGHNALPLESLDRFLGLLVDKTGRTFPEYSCNLILQIVPTIADRKKRIDYYKNCMRCFGQRPDLAGEILLAVGDELAAQDEPAHGGAMAAYAEAATKGIKVPEVVLDATAKAEKLLCDANRHDQAAAMYEQLIRQVQPSRNNAFTGQSVHYQLSVRLLRLYEQMGRTADAARLKSSLGLR